ncbi:thioesterase II family protein [Streptomyces sp. NPDC002755]|uniref:thioesterase II family protein n=1 Tax=Streptomyces sp. NPDC002884 TaxID=3154544 RepID=UPI003325B70F
MTQTASWIRRLDAPAGAAAPDPQLVCFPHAGGSAGFYRPLAAELAGHAEVLGVQYPGRQDRYAEPVVTDVHQLADRVAEVLGQGEAGRPRALFGHSLGAVVAYEVAARLGDAAPVALIVSGRPAPSRIRRSSAYLLPEDALVEQVRSLGGTESELLDHPELRSLLLPLIRGDYRASETYRFGGGPPLGCPVVAVTGDDDPLTPVADARVWAEHTTGPFRLQVLSGGHFFLTEHWAELARTVRSGTEAALARPRRHGPAAARRVA